MTAVRQSGVAMRNRATVSLDGTDLTGSPTTVLVGGVQATITNATRDRVTVTLPFHPAPGWIPVTMQNNAGSTTNPRGLAVLPLLEADPTPAPGKAFDLVFRGSPGDQILWAMGIAVGPPIPLPGALYGFAIVPPTFLVFSGFGVVTRADGILRLPIPPQSYPVGLIYLQGLFRTSNPGYGPAAFSNVLRL